MANGFDSAWYAKQLAKRPARNEGANPQPQHAVRVEPLAARQAEEAHPGRCRVVIESRRIFLTDPDNFCGKYHIDALRYLKLIRDDTVAAMDLHCFQVKVRRRVDEKTIITVERL